MGHKTYEIRLRGVLRPEALHGLPGTSCNEVGSQTVLLTLDVDQRSLHQLIARLRDLGIELLELRLTTESGLRHDRGVP